MKAVFFETMRGEEEIFRPLLDGFDLEFNTEKLVLEDINLAQNAEIVSVFINSELNAGLIGALPKLKHIATRSTGFDHIDLAFAQEKNVSVSNVPAYGSHTVAEFAFGLILNLSRKIFSARKYLMESDNFNLADQFQGFDLCGKTLGVVGTGKIGKNVVKIAQSFGMKVAACDIYPDQEFAQELGFEYSDLSSLLAKSDIVTLHTPYSKENHHLINANNIGLMKKGAYLINTARGELVATEALLKALETGHLAGAGLDVLEAERELKEEAELLSQYPERIKDVKTLLQDHRLMNMPQVVITPHIAFFSKEAHQEILKITAQNIKDFAAGQPQNLVPVK